MFYGAVVKPGVTVELNGDDGEVLHLSGACLHNPSNDERTYLVLNQNDKNHVICVLKKDSAENVPLDIFVATREGGHFKVQGKSEVHLIGYYEPMMSDSEDDGDIDSDIDGASDDENVDIDALIKQAKTEKKKKATTAALVSAEAEENSSGEEDEVDDDEDDDDDENDNEAAGDMSDEDKENEEDDDEDDEEEEEEIRRAIQQQMQKRAEKLDKKKEQSKTASLAPAVPATSDSGKKRKAADPVPTKPGKQQKAAAPGTQGASHFEKAVTDYLKKHGRCLISQVASACPKPASVASKYREFLVSRPAFIVEGQHVALKA